MTAATPQQPRTAAELRDALLVDFLDGPLMDIPQVHARLDAIIKAAQQATLTVEHGDGRCVPWADWMATQRSEHEYAYRAEATLHEAVIGGRSNIEGEGGGPSAARRVSAGDSSPSPALPPSTEAARVAEERCGNCLHRRSHHSHLACAACPCLEFKHGPQPDPHPYADPPPATSPDAG